MLDYQHFEKQKHTVSVAFIFVLLFAITLFAETQEAVKIGILAKRGSEQTLQRWQPLAHYLNGQLPAYRFEIVPLGFDALDSAVARNEIDFVLTNTMQYVALEYRYGVSRIATLQNHSDTMKGQQQFGGVIFTRSKNTAIHALQDLRNKRFAAVDPASFGGWVMAKKEMLDHGITEDDFSELLFLHSHDAVVRAILDGDADAGTVRSDTLERMASEGKIRLEEVHVIAPRKYPDFPFMVSTALYPEWPFSKLSHTSDALAESVLIALLGIEPGLDVAKRTDADHWTIPLDYSPVHDLLKTLNMPPYDVQITLSAVIRKYAVQIISASIIIVILTIAVVLILLLYRRLHKQTLRIGALNKQLTQQMEREQIFRQMLDSQTALTMLGDEKRIIECNQAFLDFFAIESTEEMVRRGGLCAYIVDEYSDQEHHLCLSEALATKEQSTFSKIVMKDQEGKRRVFSVHLDRFAHDDSLFVINFVDITANEVLHQRLMLLQKAINQSNNTVLISTIDGVVEYVNNAFCECTGYSETELLGHHAELMNTMGLNPLASRELYTALSEDKVWIGEVIKVHKDGCEHIIHIAISPIKDLHDQTTHLIAIGEDVSQYRQIERKLKEKEQMLLAQSRLAAVGEMLSMIAHQWRQPLSVIQMSLNDLELTLSLMDIPEQENIRTITEHVQFLSGTIDDFSNYFQKEGHVEEVEFDSLSHDAIRLFEKSLENRGITISCESHVAMQLHTRRQDVVQVLLNLISNARDTLLSRHIADAAIRVCGSYASDEALFVIEIIDNAGGVDDTIKHQIFEPYFSTKETKEGSGLGLYICKIMVENHLHGSIGFENRDDGACFYIKIPSLPPEEEMLFQ